jgi:hypothetical protein
MKTKRRFSGWAGLAALVTLLAPACSSDDDGDDDGGLGGAAGSGGVAGSGGSSAAGAAGSGGAAGASGAAGAAGSGGAAGASGAAGAAGSGGAAGASGNPGALSFADDVLPILQVECGDCHAFFIPFASEDAQQSYQVAIEATSYEGEDQPRYDVIVARAEDGTMPPECAGGAPGSSPDCISEEDFEILQDWANSGEPPPP